MAEDRLPCPRSESIEPTRVDIVEPRATAISRTLFQNASSRLTLVLWPFIMMERLTTADFIARLQYVPVMSSVSRLENVMRSTNLYFCDNKKRRRPGRPLFPVTKAESIISAALLNQKTTGKVRDQPTQAAKWSVRNTAIETNLIVGESNSRSRQRDDASRVFSFSAVSCLLRIMTR